MSYVISLWYTLCMNVLSPSILPKDSKSSNGLISEDLAPSTNYEECLQNVVYSNFTILCTTTLAPRMGVTSHGMVLCAKNADKKVRWYSGCKIGQVKGEAVDSWYWCCWSRLSWVVTRWLKFWWENELGLDDFDLINWLCMVHVLLHHNRNGKRLLIVHKRVPGCDSKFKFAGLLGPMISPVVSPFRSLSSSPSLRAAKLAIAFCLRHQSPFDCAAKGRSFEIFQKTNSKRVLVLDACLFLNSRSEKRIYFILKLKTANLEWDRVCLQHGHPLLQKLCGAKKATNLSSRCPFVSELETHIQYL